MSYFITYFGEAYVQEINSAIAFQEKYLRVAARKLCQEGMFFYTLREYLESVRCFDEAIHLSPNFTEAHYRRGDAYLKLGEIEHAIKDYFEGLRLEGYDLERDITACEVSGTRC